ncbi:MAG: sigma-70 family RNA polymerase sigma factor [Planctomycetes bacterium]|nr:sigma-70 family RNA polymerase sigma factor [Planctomycetota bacterium]
MVEKIWQRQQKKKKWLQLLRGGDHQAFAEFIEKYKETVFLCCRRLGLKEDEAEDVASETFMAAFKGIGRYRGRAELSTWLWTIAYRQGINYLRKNRKQWQLEVEPDEQVGGSKEPEPAAAIQDRETEKIVWEAVERLPRLWAMAVVLYYREEKSIVDITKIMQIKENTVKTYLFRGRDKLKQILTAAFQEDIDGGR